MIFLVSTSDKLQLVTGQAVTVDVHTTFTDYTATPTSTPGNKNTAITTAVTSDIVAAPGGAGIYRNVKTIVARNKHASASVDVTIQHVNATGTVELYKATLLPQQSLMYTEELGFFVTPVAMLNALLTSIEQSGTQRVLTNNSLANGALGAFTMVAGTSYFVYMGRLVRDVVVSFVELQVTTVGAGAQTAELGLFTSLAAPNKTNQTLTKLIATGSIGALTALGVVRNTVSFAQLVTAGTHLWAAFRQSMVTTQTQVAGHAGDMAEGHMLLAAASGALTGLTSIGTTLPASNVTTTIGPVLRAALD